MERMTEVPFFIRSLSEVGGVHLVVKMALEESNSTQNQN